MHRIVALALLAALARPSAAAELAASPPEQNLAEFRAVCDAMRGDNPYFGEQIADELRERVREAGDDPLLRVLLRARLAWELIRLGRHQEALANVEEALGFLQQADLAGAPEMSYRLLSMEATAHLQLAEDLNCIANHAATSCILPVRPGAVHSLPEHARRAGDLYLELLQRNPNDGVARWLLGVSRMITGDYPAGVPEAFRLPERISQTPAGPTWKEVGFELGIDAVDLSGGAIMDDFDGDGLLDLVSSSWDPCQPLKAFRNDGAGGFEDVSEAWGLSSQLGGLNLVQVDFDGDRALDLLVLRGAWLGEDGRIRNSLLKNDLRGASGRFLDVTVAAGVAYPAYPTQNAAWADYDRDGDLDVFIGNEATASSTDPLELFGKTGNSYPSQLFRNNGDGTFTDVARSAGVTNRRYAKGASWGDYDGDGDLDLYVSNIGPNRLYRNNSDGTFTDVAEDLGVTEPRAGSFPTWFFDYDNDGDLDLFVAPFNAPPAQVFAGYLGQPTVGGRPALYRNEEGRFTDVSFDSGFRQPLLVMGANFGDLDGDGWLDLYLGTGVPDYDALMPNVAYHNEQGRGFSDVTFETGLGHLQKGHGVAFGDIDNDGEEEIFEQLGGAFPYDTYGNALYDHPRRHFHWLTLQLEQAGGNRFAVGARLEVRFVEGGVPRAVYRTVGAGGSFGGSSLQQEIGLGDAERIDRITVWWPEGGNPQVFDDVTLDRIYRIVRGASELQVVDLPRIELGRRPATGDHHHEGARR